MYKKNKKILNNLLDNNSVILDNLNNIKQNFRDLLDIKCSLTYKDSYKLTVLTKSKINHLSLINLKKSKFIMKNVLTGIDLEKSYKIYIKVSEGILSKIKLKNCSYITIKLSNTNYNKSIIEIDNCKHIQFINLNNILIDELE